MSKIYSKSTKPSITIKMEPINKIPGVPYSHSQGFKTLFKVQKVNLWNTS